jgi:hypothetical protein
VVVVGAITSAAIAVLGWGGEGAGVLVFAGDLVAFVIYLVLMVSVILGD